MNATEREWRDVPCPRCGTDAQWSFADADKSRIEIICPDCGRFDMAREEFDLAANENTELTRRERT